MANLVIKDGDGSSKYIKSVGAGSDGDPQINHVVICDVNGLPVEVDRGSLNIHHVDVHGVPVNTYAHRLAGVDDTLAVAASIGDTSIQLNSATGFSVGNVITLNGDESFAKITVISTNTLTLDQPIDVNLAISDTIAVVSVQMIDNGSLASPLSYKIEPPSDEVWHILRVIFTMTHSSAGDLAKFGSLAALTNGLLMRSDVGGVISNISLWKDNGDIKTDMFDMEFTDKAGGASIYGTSGRYTFSKLGVAVKLDGSTGDSLELLVQDDLSSLASFEMKGQGHIVGQ